MTARHRDRADSMGMDAIATPAAREPGALGDPLAQPHGREGRLEALLSSGGGVRGVGESFESGGVFPHGADEDVGELPFVARAGFSGCLALALAAGQVGLGGVVHTGLGDVDDVQDAI